MSESELLLQLAYAVQKLERLVSAADSASKVELTYRDGLGWVGCAELAEEIAAIVQKRFGDFRLEAIARQGAVVRKCREALEA